MKMVRGSWIRIGVALAAVSLVAGGCPSDIDNPGNDGTESADSTGVTTGADETDGMSGPVATSAMSTTDVTTGPGPGADTTAGMDEAGFITNGSTDDSGMPLPNGQQCGGNDSCDSGFCYMIPVLGGGVCSECLEDGDCDKGESCQIDVGLLYAVCGEAGLGVMCSGDDSCGDLTCELLLDTGGVFDITTCSECGPDNPCPTKGDTCSPVVNIELPPSGYLTCQAPASQPNGATCPWDNATMSGDGTPCMSGICAPADVAGLGFITVGVCGECATDMDCPMNGTCMPGAAEQSGITGSTCI